jgi:hypothetical protein
VRRLRAEAWLWAREKPAHEDTVGGVKVTFYKHPDVDAVDQIELVDVEIYWRDGTISQVVLSGRVVYDEPVLTLKGCNVDAEIRCGSSFNCVYRGILDLLARLGVDEKTAMAVEVQVW